ncbi:mini-chromosome maintenance complex-binding protein [Bacillus rossius redtenbacheri]|uniref:mini-chromosome maintenance complex-binding protein n=1 Tax=Bacillus rossius redtenbacheri TaxID=93214 RepID=UPI002FDDE1F7
MCSWSIAFWEANTEECRQHLKSDDAWESIPLLCQVPSDELVDGQLMRFRGMIQDMYDPEFYLSQYEVVSKADGCSSVRSGKFKETIAWEANEEFVQDSARNVHSERHSFYCVPVPGINPWVHSLHRDANSKPGVQLPVQEANTSEACAPECSKVSPPKRVCLDSNSQARLRSTKQSDLNFPLPGQEGTVCMLKVYDGERFRLNDVVEVVGFVSASPATGEGDAPCPGVPGLHCVAVRRLTHCNPLWSAIAEREAVFEGAESVRQELHMLLSGLLLGDTLAAEYLLCHLLSSVYLRNNTMALGKMSLNVTNVPTGCDYANKMYNILSLLLPKSHFLPMTLDNLNKQTFVPKKDYSENRLKSGVLQLSAHTHLVLDETQLMPGQLDACGVQNVTALGMVVRHQKLDYDFKYYSLEFETDIPVLVLSEGKSLLPSDVVIPLRADSPHVAETFEAATHYLKEPLLGNVRVYLTAMMQANFTVPAAMQEVIENDFVEMRKENSKFTPDDLHRLLVLARLVSLSRGCRELTAPLWKHAVDMERRRQQR